MRLPTPRHLALALCFSALAACGDSATPDPADGTSEIAETVEHPGEDLELVAITGTVTVAIPQVAARVINAFDDVAVTDVGFTLQSPAGDRNLAIVLSAAGHPLALAWLGPEHTAIDAHTTAEVLAFFALGGFRGPRDLHGRIIALLDGAPELDYLADQVIARNGFNYPDGFGADEEEVNFGFQAQLEDACEDLLAPDAPAAPRIPKSLLINPSGEASGVRIDNLGALNQLTFTNRFRRRAFAFVDRVGVTHGGIETVIDEPVTRFGIEPVAGLRDGVGTLQQIVIGAAEPGELADSDKLAYTPKSFGPITVPNVEGADRTRYRVAVVGPGDKPGDRPSLRDAEQLQQRETSLEFVVRDYLIPFITDVIAPTKVILSSDSENLVTAELMDLLREHPDVMDDAITGKVGQVLQLVLSVGAYQGKLPVWVLDLVVGAVTTQVYGADAAAAASKRTAVVAQLKKVLQVFAAVNVTLKLYDSGMIEQDMRHSNQGDVWEILVSDAQVRLDPVESTLPPGDFVTLTANVVDAGDNDVFEYRYTTPGAFGTLQSALVSGNDITSAVPFVTYDAKEPGSEQVKVTVFQVVGSERVEVGSAEAIVNVAGTGVRITPTGETAIDPFGEQLFTATVSGDAVPAALVFRWSTDGAFGDFGGETTVEAQVNGDTGHAVTFVAGFERGDQELLVEVFEPGAEEPLARSRVRVRVNALRVAIAPATASVDAGGQVPLTATVSPSPPIGSLVFAWDLGSSQGLIDGVRSVEHTVTGADSDSVTYQADTQPVGCGQLVTVRVSYSANGKSVNLLPARARMRVDCPAEAVLLAPRDVIDTNSRMQLLVDVTSESELGALTYRWSAEGEAGGHMEGAGGVLGATPTSDKRVNYVSGSATGYVEVTCVVYEDGVVIAEASKTLTVVEEPPPPCQEAFDFGYWNAYNRGIHMSVSGQIGGTVTIDIAMSPWTEDYYRVDVYIARGVGEAQVSGQNVNIVNTEDGRTVYTDYLIDDGGMKVRVTGAIVDFVARGPARVTIATAALSPPCEEGPGAQPCCPYVTYDSTMQQPVMTGPLVVAVVSGDADHPGGLAIGVIESN